jgi:hypothetical protein
MACAILFARAVVTTATPTAPPTNLTGVLALVRMRNVVPWAFTLSSTAMIIARAPGG